MKPLIIPEQYNYIAVFLTLACNLRCHYCINRAGGGVYTHGQLTGDEWLRGLNRIVARPDLPVTLGGGEPSLHPDFLAIVKGIRSDLSLDLLTNLQFDSGRFAEVIPPDRLRRAAPYASIRVSYHPESMELMPLVEKVLVMQKKGYSIGIWGILHPEQEQAVLAAREQCLALGIDFRTKEFLGEHDGEMHGSIKYPGACGRKFAKRVLCRSSELIIGPDGGIYRCHSDLYEGREAIGNILDPDFEIDRRFLPCEMYGHCNPCDVKVKTNRFQVFGHTSVEIIMPEEES